VLAWQSQGRGNATKAEETTTVAKPWNPGELTDDDIGGQSIKGLLAKARLRWEEGALVECLIGAKPSARFYDLGLSVRFPVPGDLRYAHCDCGQTAPCLHALLAVFAFRQMPPGQQAGLIASGAAEKPEEESVLLDAERVVINLLRDGIGGVPGSEVERWKRSVAQLQATGLIWLAGIVEELLLERERYVARDALFAPENVAMLAGELLNRCDALRHGRALPRGLAGGWKTNEKTAVGYTRWIGLGALVTVTRKSVKLQAMLQEADTGSLGAVEREVVNPDDGTTEPEDFGKLSRVGIVKGAGIRGLGAGQVLTENCNRTPDNRLAFGRARAQVSTQAFEWEKLRPPVLVEDFTELKARLGLLPPRSLRPRRLGEDFHVLTVARNTAGTFDFATQTLTAELFDASGQKVTLRHPWLARGEAGFERLAASLLENSVLFVSGAVTLTPLGITIQPAGVVLSGAPRILLQPWVDEEAPSVAANDEEPNGAFPTTETRASSLPGPWEELGELMMDTLVTGRTKNSGPRLERWQRLREDAELAGCRLVSNLALAICDAERRSLEGEETNATDLLSRAVVAWRSAVDLV
jgi:hypothetical protein